MRCLTTQQSSRTTPVKHCKNTLARGSVEQQPVSRAEIAALKGNYETLLSLLRRQEEERQRQIEEKEAIQIHYEESTTEMEISMQSLQVENLKMRDTIRQMLSQTQGMEVAFELYESDILRLEAQVHDLQVGKFNVQSEFTTLRIHNQELQKSKRQAAVQRRCFEEAGKKANKLGAEVKREQAEHRRAAAALHTADEQVVALENECAMLRDHNFETNSSTEVLRRQVAALKEAARTNKLNMKKELLASKYTASQPRLTAPKGIQLHRTCREICNKLEITTQNFDPKSVGLINRLKRELTKLENERQEKSDREHELVELLLNAQEKIDASERSLK